MVVYRIVKLWLGVFFKIHLVLHTYWYHWAGCSRYTNSPNYIELDKLSNLVADYEEVYLPISKPSLIDTIKLRMFEMDLSQKKLADLLGVSASRISEYLAGKRNISFEVAKNIHKKLDIDAEIILG